MAAVLAIVATVIVNAPANWLALQLASRTDGIVLLADAQGTIWSGSAVLGLGAPVATGPAEAPDQQRRLALPGRVTWTLDFERALAPVLHLKHDGVLLQPLAVRYRDGALILDASAAALPAAILQLAGAPLNTLRPEGRCELRWNGLRFPATGAPVGDGTLRIADFSLAVSAVKPLGDYRATWASADGGLSWQVATERGPLDVQGMGLVAGRRSQVRVVVRIAAGTPAGVVAQLNPLLDLIGRRGTDEAVIASGSRS